MQSRWFVPLPLLLVISSLGATAVAADTHHDHGGQSLGAVDFGVPCAEEVRKEFDRGLGLLHHMMYVEAQDTFESVAARDPKCAMAHWGVAMTLFQPLWPTRPGTEDLARGRKEIETARASLSSDAARERALIEATAAFYADVDADWWARLRAWASSMEKAFAAHPKDLDTAALYALSRLAIAPVSTDREAENARAAKVLLGVYEKSATHPGAIHYTIHANDIDSRAGESLEIVRRYDDIAPSVPHALHMPTHIFVRLGEWPSVIEWNRKSADAALRFPAGNTVSHHFAHATDYLTYAYLQQGDDERARAVVEETLGKDPHQPSFISAFHLASMPARYAVERRAWKEAAVLEPRTPASIPWDSFAWPEAISWFARGLGGAWTGDLARAREAEAKMTALRDRMESAGEKDFSRYIEIDRKILAARLQRVEGKNDAALDLLRAAVALEGTVQKHPVTPGALLPPGEALCELLLELDRPSAALAACRASDEAWRGRYRTLLAAARAATAAGDAEAARGFWERLLEVAGGSSRPELSEAKRTVGAVGGRT